MTKFLFLGFVMLMTVGVFAMIVRYHAARNPAIAITALSLWLLYVGVIGYLGVTRNTAMRPPGAAFLFIPVVLFLIFFILRARPLGGPNRASAFPLWILLGAQCFRIIVELFIHQLWKEGIVPKMLTFEGANVDIYIGAAAPLVAWLATRGGWGLRLAFVWNVLGLLALANVVVRAVATTPGPLNLIHAEVPNLMFGTFPFMFIPGFFVPLAVVLHVLAIRAVSGRLR